jgi:choline dehydrogenase-like flavoprotein
VSFRCDEKTNVLDLNCKAHDLDNLYVVDGSFMVTSAAVNPTLTIIANALRVGEHLLERLGVDEAVHDADHSRSEAEFVMVSEPEFIRVRLRLLRRPIVA